MVAALQLPLIGEMRTFDSQLARQEFLVENLIATEPAIKLKKPGVAFVAAFDFTDSVRVFGEQGGDDEE